MTLVTFSNMISNMIDIGSIVVNEFMEFEIYGGKNILSNFILYPEMHSINKFENKLQIKFKQLKK